MLEKKQFVGDLLIIILLSITAVYVRLLPWDFVFSNGEVYFPDGDCYMRYRKIMVYLASFPKTLVYDYYQGFPVGTGAVTPPTMEYIFAALAYLFRGDPSLAMNIKKIMAFIPPLLGGVTVALSYIFLKKHFGSISATAGALLIAISPLHIETTILGRFDNEMAEPILLLLVVLFYVRTYDEEKTSHWVLLGLMNMLYLSIWRGALFPLSLVGIDLLCRIARKENVNVASIASNAALMYGVTAAAVGFIWISDVWGTRELFTYNIISGFHVLLFVAAAVLFFVLKILVVNGARGFRKPVAVFLLVFLLLSLLLLAANLAESMKVIFRGNPWLDSISQYQPGFDGTDIWTFFGLFVPFSTLVLLLLKSQTFQPLKIKRFIVMWTLIMFVALVFRERFALYYVLNAAVCIGILMRWSMGYSFCGQKYAAVVACGIVLFLLQIPAFGYFGKLHSGIIGVGVQVDYEEAMKWLRYNTLVPGDSYKPSSKPTYGVLASWDLGGFIETIALRPAIATLYGTETYGIEEAAKFFTCSDESEMRALFYKNMVGYVIVTDTFYSSLSMYSRLLGDRKYYSSLRDSTGLISARLFLADGSESTIEQAVFAPVEGVALVYESSSLADINGFPGELKRIKIFRINSGIALSVVGGHKGDKAELIQRIQTNRGRIFTYRNTKHFDAHGVAQFKIMYGWKMESTETGSISPVTIHTGSQTYTIDPDPDAVIAGKQITLRLRQH